MHLSGLFYTIHPLPRFLIGAVLLLSASAAAGLAGNLLLAAISLLLIRYIEDNWQRVKRVAKLLRWFLIPILVLHACFSPGRLIFPGMPLPLTYEGLMQGVQLSLHLTAIFLAATALFICLRRSEWFAAALSLPFVKREQMLYLLLMLPLRGSVALLLRQLQLQWQQRKSWSGLPMLLVSAFRSTLTLAIIHSEHLWLRWPHAGLAIHSVPRRYGAGLALNLLCIAAALLLLFAAWRI